MLENKKIVIAGLGLMGASLGLALRKGFPKARIIGLSRSDDTVRRARRRGAIDTGTTRLEEAARQADWVVICTPVRTIPRYLREIDRAARSGTIVTDVGSAKENITAWADRWKFKNIRFVGSHPMAGSHERGLEHARADLYREALCLVVPGRRTERADLRRVTAFWKRLCREVRVIDPKAHDRIVSRISHLPHVISSLLVLAAGSEALPFAGSGFRDTTRIAQGDPHLWQEILLENRKNLAGELRRFQKRIGLVLNGLSERESPRILAILKRASETRKKLPSSAP